MSPSISDSGAGIANTTVIHASLEIGRVHANESSSTRSAISATEDVSVPKAVGVRCQTSAARVIGGVSSIWTVDVHASHQPICSA